MHDDLITLPRLYTPESLGIQSQITLNAGQAHYLKNVLRQELGAKLKVFNGKDGEFLADITMLSKKSGTARITERLRAQPENTREIHLVFSPLQKHRMDFLIEKSVELGVTHFHPTIMKRSNIRKINVERLEAQIIEACEQCERLDIPTLTTIKDLHTKITPHNLPTTVLWARERMDQPPSLKLEGNDTGIIIGPPGGFAPEETALLEKQAHILPISLGPDILRTETAALCILSALKLRNMS